MKAMTLTDVQTLRDQKAAANGLAVSETFEDGSIVFMGGDSNRYLFLAYIGRQSKPAAFYHFKTEEARNAYGERWKAERGRVLDAKKVRKAEARKPHSLKVGDVLYTSWGYEQTNVEFYEVLAVRGCVVDLRELAKDVTEYSHGMQGRCVPKPGQYVGGVYKSKRPNGDNAVRFNSFCYGRPWDGTPKSWSSYA